MSSSQSKGVRILQESLSSTSLPMSNPTAEGQNDHGVATSTNNSVQIHPKSRESNTFTKKSPSDAAPIQHYFGCPRHCGEVFFTQEYALAHASFQRCPPLLHGTPVSSTMDPKIECPKRCGRTFTQNGEVNYHITSSKSCFPFKVNPADQSIIYECPIHCGKIFSRPEHVRVHFGQSICSPLPPGTPLDATVDPRFECRMQCGKSFTLAENARLHEKNCKLQAGYVKPEKKIPCPYLCGRMFGTKGNAEDHAKRSACPMGPLKSSERTQLGQSTMLKRKSNHAVQITLDPPSDAGITTPRPTPRPGSLFAAPNNDIAGPPIKRRRLITHAEKQDLPARNTARSEKERMEAEHGESDQEDRKAAVDQSLTDSPVVAPMPLHLMTTHQAPNTPTTGLEERNFECPNKCGRMFGSRKLARKHYRKKICKTLPGKVPEPKKDRNVKCPNRCGQMFIDRGGAGKHFRKGLCTTHTTGSIRTCQLDESHSVSRTTEPHQPPRRVDVRPATFGKTAVINQTVPTSNYRQAAVPRPACFLSTICSPQGSFSSREATFPKNSRSSNSKMAAQSVPSPLIGFKRLNASTYIYEPPTTSSSFPTSSSSSSAPDLILLPSWLDAAPRHIAKYTHGYQALYPSARILLLTTSLADVTLHTRPTEAARLAPAISLLAALPPHNAILLHSFSNGGAYTAHLLARLYRARTGHVLPLRAQILDSAPGLGQYGRTATALAMGLPRGPAVLRFVGWVVLHLFLAAYFVAKTATSAKNKIQVMGDGLLDCRYWDVGVPRCYVYSREDEMVVWGDVVEHAAQAEGKGWKRVSVEEFEGSAHCGHLLVDEGRYWGVVERVWGER